MDTDRKYPATSDNRYPDRPFSAATAGEWIGITSKRVRQLAKIHGVGEFLHKSLKNSTIGLWTFTLEEVKLLDILHKSSRGKSRMRDVTPRDPAAVAKLMEAEDGILRYLKMQLQDLRRDTFDLIRVTADGVWNATVKELDRKERLIAELRGSLDALRTALRENGIKINVRPMGSKEESESGRWGSTLGGLAPITPVEADGAAA